MEKKHQLGIAIIAAAVAIAGGSWYVTQVHPLSKMKDAVSANLIDPGSAQFRFITEQDGGFCGEISGKNQFGAYVGFTMFFYKDGSGVVTEEMLEELGHQSFSETLKNGFGECAKVRFLRQFSEELKRRNG